MKLITKEIERRTPELYVQDSKGEDAKVYAHFFAPWSGWEWFLTEYNAVERTGFGLVKGHYDELGYFSIDELESIRGPYGVRIERDMSWQVRTLAEVR